MLWRHMCVFFVVFKVTFTDVTSNPEVNGKLGKIRGLQAEDGDYSMYLGIPYGDIDENKPFGDSTPHPPFESVFIADDDSAKCPQQDEYTKEYTGDFDCLRLNIYVPNNLKPNETLPVLVWIHGGGFLQGNYGRFLYGPKFLMRQDIILITINYRLGVYGFLCLDSPEIPGNQGLKDQVLALRWIKNNIDDFGGDPYRVTLMGQSVGALFAELHMISKNEKLFDAAILQSGSVNEPEYISTIESNKMIAIEICKNLGFVTNNTDEIVQYLKKTNPLKNTKALFDLGKRFPICIENSYPNVSSMVTERPRISTISRDKIVPILGGFNSREELVMYTDYPERFLTKDLFYSNLKHLFRKNQSMLDIIHRFYLGDQEISPAAKENLIDFRSDFNHNYPTQKSLLEHMKQGAPVYQYLFSYSGTRNLVKSRFNISDLGASHADEISYIFDISYDKQATRVDWLMIDRMTTLWANFVKYRNPTPEITELIPVKWIPINQKKLPYLNIDVNMTMDTSPFNSRMAFWDLLYYAFEKEMLKFKR